MSLTVVKPEDEIGNLMRRCPEATVGAAIEIDQTGDPLLVPVIILGIIERYVEPSYRLKARNGDDGIQLTEDHGIDSLLLVEIVKRRVELKYIELMKIRFRANTSVDGDCITETDVFNRSWRLIMRLCRWQVKPKYVAF